MCPNPGCTCKVDGSRVQLTMAGAQSVLGRTSEEEIPTSKAASIDIIAVIIPLASIDIIAVIIPLAFIVTICVPTPNEPFLLKVVHTDEQLVSRQLLPRRHLDYPVECLALLPL
jgi:hypothetical protein